MRLLARDKLLGLARLHQANRRAAAFEARCAQLLEEKTRLEAKVEGWRKIADGYARSASLEYRDNLEGEIWTLQDRLSELLEENERLRESLAWAVGWIDFCAEIPVPGFSGGEHEAWKKFVAARRLTDSRDD